MFWLPSPERPLRALFWLFRPEPREPRPRPRLLGRNAEPDDPPPASPVIMAVSRSAASSEGTFFSLYAAMTTCLVYLAAGAVLTARGKRNGRYFLAATTVLAVGTIIYSMRSLMLIPPWPMTDYAAQLARSP